LSGKDPSAIVVEEDILWRTMEIDTLVEIVVSLFSNQMNSISRSSIARENY